MSSVADLTPEAGDDRNGYSECDGRETVVIATGNRGKLREMISILGEERFRFLTLPEIGFEGEIVEDGDSFSANAEIKAETIARWIRENRPEIHRPAAILADDSGLEVDALGGDPGIRSARFAGPGATDADNVRRLLQLLTGEENRTARFRCVIALIRIGNGKEREPIQFYEGICRGTLLADTRGENGFGYDPIFVPDGESRTFAEMTGEEKHRFSHRGAALKKLAAATAR